MNFIKKYENIHIGLWLLKDICWMMEFKILGVIMVIPTISMAVYIMFKTFNSEDFFINLAVFFWIMANSIWMISEFFNLGTKYFGLPFFILGIVVFLIYSYKTKGRFQ